MPQTCEEIELGLKGTIEDWRAQNIRWKEQLDRGFAVDSPECRVKAEIADELGRLAIRYRDAKKAFTDMPDPSTISK